MPNLKIGMVGLDTSHAKVFSNMLNDEKHERHVPGGHVTVAYPGGSEDFKPSINRVAGYTQELRDNFGVTIVDSPEAVAESCDAILLTSVDGRVHLDQFRKIAPFGKPVFIDKPLTVSSAEARELAAIAERYGVPWMTASPRRFAPGLRASVAGEGGVLTGADSFGPIEYVDAMPGWYWYGIHIVEAIYAIMGKGCVSVTAAKTDNNDAVAAVWNDGRIATLRANRLPNRSQAAVIHRLDGSVSVDTGADGQGNYELLLTAIMEFFRTGKPAVDPEESLETIRFIEALNESRETGQTVRL